MKSNKVYETHEYPVGCRVRTVERIGALGIQYDVLWGGNLAFGCEFGDDGLHLFGCVWTLEFCDIGSFFVIFAKNFMTKICRVGCWEVGNKFEKLKTSQTPERRLISK